MNEKGQDDISSYLFSFHFSFATKFEKLQATRIRHPMTCNRCEIALHTDDWRVRLNVSIQATNRAHSHVLNDWWNHLISSPRAFMIDPSNPGYLEDTWHYRSAVSNRIIKFIFISNVKLSLDWLATCVLCASLFSSGVKKVTYLPDLGFGPALKLLSRRLLQLVTPNEVRGSSTCSFQSVRARPLGR